MPQRPKHTMLVSQFELEFNSCFRWLIFTIDNFNRCSLVRDFVSCANPFSADVIFAVYRIFDLDSMRKGCAIHWNMAKFEYMQRAFSSELKPRARLVLQVLVLHCNKEGECFPSIKTIAAKCGYGVSTVKRALDELVKAGYIVKQARFDERKNGGQTSNLYTLCSDLLCPDKPENAPVLEDDASDESPAVQPESAPADACNASDPTPGEQSATLPTADSYSFADGFETKIGRQFCRPIRMWTGGQSIFIPP